MNDNQTFLGMLFGKRWYLPLFFIAIIITYPFFVSNYLIDIAFFFGIYALLGLSLNIVLGEVGLFSLTWGMRASMPSVPM